MYNFSRVLSFAAVGAIVLVIAGCGDGSTSVVDSTPASTSNSPATTPPIPTPGSTAAEATVVTISGVVATGAPCENAQVRFPGLVTDPVNIRTAKDGTYSANVTIPASAAGKAQVLQADCPNDTGGADTLVSVMASPASGTINFNPFTNLLCVLVSKSGDPKQCGSVLADGTISVDVTDIKSRVEQFKTMLFPLLTALAVDAFDPISGAFAANGTGFDRVLDMVDISTTAQADGTSLVQIRLKIKSANETDSQPVIQFTNVTPTDAILLANSITRTSVGGIRLAAGLVIPNGTSDLIADLVVRMNACYALPPASRWNGRDALAPTCAAMFLDGDVSNYLENGLKGINAFLSYRTGLAYSDSPVNALLTDPAVVKFGKGRYEYIKASGALGFSTTKTSASGTPLNAVLEAQTGVDGKLGLSGNQYNYEAKVVPMAERRTFLNQSKSSYFSTGINILAPLQSKGGIPLVSVVVTPPPNRLINTQGFQYSYKLFPGASGMALPMQDQSLNDLAQTSSDGLLRLRSEYVDTAANANSRHPSLRDYGQYFAKEITESALTQFGVGEIWKLEFYFGDATSPDASQYYRLPARPYTIAELRAQTLPDLQAQVKQSLQALLITDGGDIPGVTPLSGLSPLSLAWTGTPTPDEVRVLGYTSPPPFTSTIFFTDFSMPGSGAPASQIVPCRNGSNGDLHCAADGRYSSSAVLQGVELLARQPDRRELAHYFSVLQLLP